MNKFGSLKAGTFRALTPNQKEVFRFFRENKNLFLHGSAGTGKTFVLLYLCIKCILEQKELGYKKLVIVRSAVPSREIGHLPGTLTEKLEIYSLPYKAILAEIFSKDSALKILESSGIVEVISTSFVRGITLENCLVVVDESSNLTFHELNSIITRIGKNSRIFFSGDYDQSDLSYRDRNGFNAFMNIISKLSSFATVKFTLDDIVRSDIVKEYLIEKERHFSEDR